MNDTIHIIIVGLIPGASELSKNRSFVVPYSASVVTCLLVERFVDLCTANLGCSRCYCNFGTGVFGKQNYSGFDRAKWIRRTNQKHRDDVEITLTCLSKSAQKHRE